MTFAHLTTVKSIVLMSTTVVREIGGLTVMQALEIVRGCKGLNMVGGDVVEVGTKKFNKCIHTILQLEKNLFCYYNVHR